MLFTKYRTTNKYCKLCYETLIAELKLFKLLVAPIGITVAILGFLSISRACVHSKSKRILYLSVL